MHAEMDVVITTHNNADLIVALLDDLQRQEDILLKTVVMDDASSDGTAQRVADVHPEVTVISLERNQGPSRNRNTGAAQGQARYIAFLDDDITIEDPTAFKRAFDILEQDREIGQLAVRIVSGFEPDILLDCGIVSHRYHFGGLFHRLHEDMAYGLHLESRDVLGACSACTVVRRDVFELVGGFEPDFYYMCEDLDVSLRVNLAGHAVRYEPGIVVRHYESQAMGRRLERKMYLWHRNSLYTLMRNYPAGHFLKMFDLFVRLTMRGQAARSWKDCVAIAGFLLRRLPKTVRERRAQRHWLKKSRNKLLELGGKLKKDTALKSGITDLILSVTSACNARCPMCFRERDPDRKSELSVDEVRRLAEGLPRLKNLVISGGEPLLRKDLVEICEVFVRRQNPILTIPTNGSFPEETASVAKKILSLGARVLVVSLSLDGLEAYHDANRGIKGLFNKVRETYDRLVSVRRVFGPRLVIQINTCVTAGNLDELDGLHAYLCESMPEAGWVFEPVRGCSEDSEVRPLSMAEWQRLKDKLDAFHAMRPKANTKDIKRLYTLGMKSLETGRQAEPCIGGRGFVAIDQNGDLRPCELLPPVVNVRDIGLDMGALAGVAEWRAACERIEASACYCTHFCWASASWARNREDEA
ncbi:glycosyltransferase [uncultured Pseudodesulfovibrio sp.]|uniref:glycosyltransferase n=1 Tax=uncultured Pseudodesulfovibrio sp. TaxID=2035858 RepID=UPI0029C8D05E|nr:glycosyltransferase [uncultured Pseudodesulfovibrio sp.]